MLDIPKEVSMKTIVLFILLFGFLIPQVSATELKTKIDDELTQVSIIQIHVRSRTLEIIQNFQNGGLFSKIYLAGTPMPKSAKDVPFGNVGVAYKLVLNPRYIPTKNHLTQEKRKGIKNPKKFYSPEDKDNPLGKMKLYFAFSGINKNLSFGAHTTNKPHSVGHRVSEGCARLKEDDAQEIFGIILKQNSEDPELLFEQMKNEPTKSITISLKNKPKVVYLND